MTLSVSVPSFGDSFFILIAMQECCDEMEEGFRPLIRGFFFYIKMRKLNRRTAKFPSPHSGILFLLHRDKESSYCPE